MVNDPAAPQDTAQWKLLILPSPAAGRPAFSEVSAGTSGPDNSALQAASSQVSDIRCFCGGYYGDPLLSVADAAGGAWPERARKACVELVNAVRVHLVPGLGAHRLERLEPEHLEDFYERMQKSGSAAGTAHHAHRTIRVALAEAVRRGHITKNVAEIESGRRPQLRRRTSKGPTANGGALRHRAR